jgi:hypothetical protein
LFKYPKEKRFWLKTSTFILCVHQLSLIFKKIKKEIWEWTCLDENLLVKCRKKLASFFFILEKGN